VQGTLHEIIGGVLNFFTLMANKWSLPRWKQISNGNKRRRVESWCSLSPLDWHHILLSMLLACNDRILGSKLSKHVLRLKKQERRFLFTLYACCAESNCGIRSCNNQDHATMGTQKLCLDNGQIKELYDDRICNPSIHRGVEISDTSHWGHLLWRYSDFLDRKDIIGSQCTEGTQLDMTSLYVALAEALEDDHCWNRGRTNESAGEEIATGSRCLSAKECSAPAAVETTEIVADEKQADRGKSGEGEDIDKAQGINDFVDVAAEDNVSKESTCKGTSPSDETAPLEGVAGPLQPKPHESIPLTESSSRPPDLPTQMRRSIQGTSTLGTAKEDKASTKKTMFTRNELNALLTKVVEDHKTRETKKKGKRKAEERDSSEVTKPKARKKPRVSGRKERETSSGPNSDIASNIGSPPAPEGKQANVARVGHGTGDITGNCYDDAVDVIVLDGKEEEIEKETRKHASSYSMGKSCISSCDPMWCHCKISGQNCHSSCGCECGGEDEFCCAAYYSDY
jgi:hypothetical protein